MIIYIRKFSNYTNPGLLFNVIFLFGNYINLLSEFIKGLCIGLGLILIFIGFYSQNHDIYKLEKYKKEILNRILSRKFN